MRTKSFILALLLLSMVSYAFSRDDKNPVAENDFASARVMQTVEIMVLQNDFAYDGHPFKVGIVNGGKLGNYSRTDSSVIYTPDISLLSHFSTDTLRYNIIDLENNLLSDFALIIIDVTDEGFQMLDINKVNCRINAYGLQFWSMNDDFPAFYEVPAGSGISSIFSLSLWVGGKDENEQLHVAAERYRMSGEDFFSGPVMNGSAYSTEQDQQWHRVWKLNAEEVAFHRQHWQDEGYVPIENIAQWPGNGDTDLGQANVLAPYYDLDLNGTYDPMQGDFPLIKGDQAIYVLNNDDRDIHTETEGEKLGIEIQSLYYAFSDEDSALQYTAFADQSIINRSGNAYHDVYVGHFPDFDLGYFQDDYQYCDTSLESVICYNGLPVDGNGSPGQYGEHPPAQSFTCLNYPMSGFVYFNNWISSPMQDPSVDKEYYNYMRGFWLDSTHITYGGTGYGGTVPVNYMYTGDPIGGTDWTELNSGNVPGDRRGLVSSGPYTLNPGDTIHLEFALVWARDYTGDNLSSVALIKDRILDVQDFYQNFTGLQDPETENSYIRIYPNPCYTDIYIDIPDESDPDVYEYVICDLYGKNIKQGRMLSSKASNISTGDLAPGYYFIKIKGENTSAVGRFVRIGY